MRRWCVTETATGRRPDAGPPGFRPVDPIAVVRELVVDAGGPGPSYPGPPESSRVH